MGRIARGGESGRWECRNIEGWYGKARPAVGQTTPSVADLHVRRLLDQGVRLVEPHGATLAVRDEQAERDGGKAVGKSLFEKRTVRVVDHDPVVAFGADGNIGKVQGSQHGHDQ